MLGSLVTLFASLVIGSFGTGVLNRHVPGFEGNNTVSWLVSTSVSLLGVFVFLATSYYVLTNVDLHWTEVLPGSVVAALLLELTFQGQRYFIQITNENPVIQTLSGSAVLLVWLYVMANVIVFGAEVNWWRGGRARPTDARPTPA
jgi:uncharacterized BrkB/YihY/UPF0761 family membrane protein